MRARPPFVFALAFAVSMLILALGGLGCEAAALYEAATPDPAVLPDEEIVDSGFCTQANEPECTGESGSSESGSESSTGDTFGLVDVELEETCDPGDDLFAIYPHGCDPGCPGVCTVDFRGRGLCCPARRH